MAKGKLGPLECCAGAQPLACTKGIGQAEEHVDCTHPAHFKGAACFELSQFFAHSHIVYVIFSDTLDELHVACVTRVHNYTPLD